MSEAEDLTQNSPPRSGLGEELRRAREAKNFTLNHVAQNLKLGVEQIQAIENEDWQALPGRVFIVGFVRNYVRLLNLNLPDLNERLNASVAKEKQRLEIARGDPILPARTTDRRAMGVALIIFVIAILGYFFLPKKIFQTFEDWLPQTETLHFQGEKKMEPTVENERIEEDIPHILPSVLPQTLPLSQEAAPASPAPEAKTEVSEQDKASEKKEEKTDKKQKKQ